MKGKIKKVVLTLVIIGIILISTFAVITQNEIKNINRAVEEVKNQPLSVRILADTSSGANPLTVNFRPIILNKKGDAKYNWEFGDGNISNEEEPTHTYKENGLFSCQLIVEDENAIKTDSFNISVVPNNPPNVKIIVDETTPFKPLIGFVTLNFDAQVFDPEGEDFEYHWEIKYPQLFGSEKVVTNNKKNFSMKFLRQGRYVATLTVTDEAGNERTQYIRINIQSSRFMSAIGTFTFGISQFEQFMALIGGIFLGKIVYKIFTRHMINWLDNNWLELDSEMQKRIQGLLSLLGIDYEPPIHKANLEISEIGNINLSAYVNTNGVVNEDASVSSTFTISNNDSLYCAKNVYITLDDPFCKEEGLVDEIKKKELIVSLDIGGIISHKLFFNEIYTSWENCSNIEKLAPGDNRTIDLTVILKEGVTFQKGSYKCTLYIYQEKADYVDKIPFTIIL